MRGIGNMPKLENKPDFISCPTCKKMTQWGRQNPWRPFCCQRCKLIDLGEWLDEKNTIPGDSFIPDTEMED